ncbi:ATP-binding protein [Acidiferrimicrobium sp. IK]|uniref:ATP-binding protein n=1 Tax=Acidiferrimicrobium sp. IK TaxID=2871700 RepID=UPI0021CB7BBE|nr:ATP-binding protein [Acidiferrimicrobium sp. IK]MCU4184070.1 ATP-binding protein [Acidiferrimicrobium sp. IK]
MTDSFLPPDPALPPLPGAAGSPGGSPIRGRLFGRNVLEAVFRAAPDEDLFLGELLVGVDSVADRRYLFRVVDVTYGTEHREPGWAERVAGTLLADDERGEPGAHPLHEQDRRTYRVASCRCLGYLAPPDVPGGTRTEFRKPKSLPTQFSRVVAPEAEDFAFLAERMGDLPLGRLRSGETVVDFTVGIPGASLASHVGVFATTGMGKSNLMQVLAAGAMRANGRYGLLIIDPHGEYRTALGRHPWASSALRVYANRALPSTTSLRISLAELTVDDLRTAYDWSRPQEEALYELERHYSTGSSDEGLAWLAEFARVDDLPGFRDVELSSRVALSTLQVVHRRARRIIDLRCVATDPSVSAGGRIISDLLAGQVVLVDVSGLGSTEEVLVASFLARRVLEEWQGAYLDDPDRHERMPVVAIALEEAQRVLSGNKDKESNVFPRVAREGRKFNVGLCAITQQPKLLDGELLSQFNTFFVLGLADERDRNILRSAAKQDISAQSAEIQTLMPGECLIVNLVAPFAVPAKVDLYRDVVRATPPPPAPRPAARPNVAALVE